MEFEEIESRTVGAPSRENERFDETVHVGPVDRRGAGSPTLKGVDVTPIVGHAAAPASGAPPSQRRRQDAFEPACPI
jgi:hypothetical protein